MNDYVSSNISDNNNGSEINDDEISNNSDDSEIDNAQNLLIDNDLTQHASVNLSLST